jgi:hypothetical protein
LIIGKATLSYPAVNLVIVAAEEFDRQDIAFVTHYPAALAKNMCFSLGGSRSGDRRVPAIWTSRNAPRLGLCWAGNPHTWRGMASAGGRAA